MFSTVLVANRGEIALRVVRTCRELGIRVAVAYSTVDRDSAAIRLADQAICVGPAPAKHGYLSIPAIIEAARACGADAIHPGYGFLSENPDFAEVCADHGMTFIGAPPEVMRRLGDKSAAKAMMAAGGLPLLPGTAGPVSTAQEAHRRASEIGYPLMIKATAGGGGRGIRVVRDATELNRIYQQTTATAKATFGDGLVYLERFLPTARHVEVQVLCDGHGNVVHLGERDCSVQRRHQKLIEESPAPNVPAGLAEKLSAAAVEGARVAGYVGVGTFEFLVDTAGQFYFMEVNARIQVEHPVTEVVTGIDLVREQLRIAAGERLEFSQNEVRPSGTAIECRVNLEDPTRDFMPRPGHVEEFVPPGGPFVRVDTHGFTGYRMPPCYDSLLAKVIVWAPDRAGARSRMRRALDEFRIAGPGIATTIPFLHRVLKHPQ
ncbi:MAG TPA: acetyl-CoA carboxylase biotin carboxylase subunit, partial [Pseudonocardiaceae bacterium]|nr:acetyl-CoA carboxylase biotin carboxylase subunit [Pseudonocardiaceae bacterium]